MELVKCTGGTEHCTMITDTSSVVAVFLLANSTVLFQVNGPGQQQNKFLLVGTSLEPLIICLFVWTLGF